MTAVLTFVYAFFPLVAVAYYLSKNRVYRNVVLLLASLLFYSWGEPRFLLLMLAATLAAYCGGLLMERSTAHKRLILIVTVVLLVGNLFVFKYLNFFSENLSALFGWRALPKLTLPIGISFYTFQILSYVWTCIAGDASAQKNPVYLAAYIVMFPQLIAGPIVRYTDVSAELWTRRDSRAVTAAGLRRFVLGLAKKILIANVLGQLVEPFQTAPFPDLLFHWLSAVGFMLQIYFDFSGYSDMAIGLGAMFGFPFLENFDYPYCSFSITDFWRRWHISLGSWFRDYVYIPLGGSRVGKWNLLRNLLVVWAVTGFWHGAQWNFLFWSLYRACCWRKLFVGGCWSGLPKAVRWLYTAFFVLIGWVLFNLTDFPSLCHPEAHVCPAGDGLGGSRCHERLPSEGRCLPAARYRVLSAAAAPGAEEHKGHSAGRPCLRSSADRVHCVHPQLIV